MPNFRRMNSMARMDGIMGDVETWFFTSPDLKGKVGAFVAEHLMDFVERAGGKEVQKGTEVAGSYLFSPDEGDDEAENARGRAHKRREVHLLFQGMFEVELEGFVQQKKVPLVQFQSVFQISQEEEIRNGENFYRWIDAAEYEVFLAMMQAAFAEQAEGRDPNPMNALREQIEGRMEAARLALRRRKQLIPLMDKWDVDDINKVLKVLKSDECPKKGDAQERKFLARWRIKLIQKQRESIPQVTPREVISDYVGRSAEDLDEDEFAALMAFLHRHVDGLALDDMGQRRRSAWRFFAAMDDLYVGSFFYEKLLKFVQRNEDDRFHNKEWKKVTTKYGAKLKKGNGERLEIDCANFQDMFIELLQGTTIEEFEAYSQWFIEKKKYIDGEDA